MKKYYRYLFLFTVSFFFFFIISIFNPIYCDEIWVYGFCHNISKGMMIYRDFNCLQMPFYFIIGNFFIHVFGDHIISAHVFDCILIGILFLILFKKKGINSILILLILVIGYSGYNLLSLFLFMVILFLIDEGKYNDFWIGILVGIIFITKQNIGVSLFFPYIYYSRNKLKSIFFFFFPFLIVSLYFGLNSALFDFLNCVFGSLFDFNKYNKYIFSPLLLVSIFVIIHLFLMIKKNKIQDKRLLYTLFFQVISYPIFDERHVYLSLVPYFYILLDYNFSKRKFYILFYLACYCSFSFFFPFFTHFFNVRISFQDNFCYLKNCTSINYPFIEDFSNLSQEYDNYFIADWYAYVYKLYYQLPIDKYDFVLSGNAGYHGVAKKIKEIDNLCREESCLFAVNSSKIDNLSQWDEFNYYIKNNYNYLKRGNGFKFYSNRRGMHNAKK